MEQIPWGAAVRRPQLGLMNSLFNELYLIRLHDPLAPSPAASLSPRRARGGIREAGSMWHLIMKN